MKTAISKNSQVSFIQFKESEDANFDEIISFTNGIIKREDSIGSHSSGNGGLQMYSRLILSTQVGDRVLNYLDVVVKDLNSGQYFSYSPKDFLKKFSLPEGKYIQEKPAVMPTLFRTCG